MIKAPWSFDLGLGSFDDQRSKSPPPKMERHQNVTICSMANRQHLKMSFKSVHNFLSCFVLSQKDSLTVT